MDLSTEEDQVLDQVKDLATLEAFMNTYIAEINDKAKHTKAWKKAYSFSLFAGPVLAIFKEASFSPECTIAFGLVGLLFIQVFQLFNQPLGFCDLT